MRNHLGDFRRLDPIPSLGCLICPDVKALVEDLTFFKEQRKGVELLLGVDSMFTPENRLKKRINIRL